MSDINSPVCVCVFSCSVAQLCLTLCNCSLPVSSVHGILQARLLERVAISFSRGTSQPRDQTGVSCISSIGRQILYLGKNHLGSPSSTATANNYWYLLCTKRNYLTGINQIKSGTSLVVQGLRLYTSTARGTAKNNSILTTTL